MFITNRRDRRIKVLLEPAENQQGVVFVAHGLGGFKEEPHIALYAKCFSNAGYTVVRYDATNSYGESDGRYEDATTTNYLEDLEDVIEWSRTQPWFEEPFVLVGHSLGSFCCILYAENHPEQIKALAPTATVVSGELSLQSPRYQGNDELKKWKEIGWREHESTSQPGLIKRLKWSHVEDRMRYDTRPLAQNLVMPVLMLVGEKDAGTPPEHQRLLFDLLPGIKELHVIPGAPHTFKQQDHLDEIQQILDAWIASLL